MKSWLFTFCILFIFFNINGSWKTFDKSNSPLNSDQILDLQRDAKSNIYIRTSYDTIFKYSKGQWSTISLSSLNIPSMNSFFVKQDGTIWIGTTKSGLYKIYQGSVYHFAPSSLNVDSLSARPIGVDDSNRIIVFFANWYGFGGTPMNLIRIDNNNDFKQINFKNFLGTSLGIGAYSSDSSGVEWFTTTCMSDVPECDKNGIYKLTYDSLTMVTNNKDWISSSYGLYSDNNSTYAANDSGLIIFKNGSTSTIDSIKGMDLKGVRCSYRDMHGTFWIGTEGYSFFNENIGLVKISGNDTTILNNNNSDFKSYFANKIVEDDSGRIWIGTWQDGLFVYSYDQSNVKNINCNSPKQLNSKAIEAQYDIRGRKINAISKLNSNQIFIYKKQLHISPSF